MALMSVNSSKINILHLRDSPWVDGPGRTIIETAASIDKSRFHYVIGGFSSDGQTESPLIDAASQRGLHAITIKERRAFDINVFRQILEYVDKNNIHIIHTHEFRSDVIGLVCAKIKRVKVMITLHGWISNGISGKVKTVLDKSLLHFFDHIVVVSERMKNQVLSLRVPERKVSLLNNCIIADRYHKDPFDKGFKAELGFTQDTVLIGSIGRLSPEKGQDILIQAASEVLRRNNNARFIFVGVGPEQPKLASLSEKLGIADYIKFVGYHKDMQRIYNSLDLVVQSSYTEGLPNVLLEALLMEVPVVATDVGGTPEIIKEQETGILINPGAIDEMVEQINKYFDNSDYFQNMAKSGKLHVSDAFNFAQRTKKEEFIYQNMICDRGRG